ncbi:molybdopterin-dependent oxidoreductase [Haloplanus aerogenes]|uniref:Molybdopterin-binding oxidoreductase n=1 Tax=Haloplanus aerogenes TaxID=660522 RepID=A0A3M0DPM5_9EURY|nr:molybdopterin-dependent oxidoreductase [Haloplanus aerogenes]AZH24567.1 molybdopterin-binding oxidoreductase [Haloplanus aerogenes]RMB23778.1 molybdopterin-dependent oxidoreductase-like protein [Haloplanus aerogenes]
MTHSDPPADADPARWTVTLAGAVADPQTMRASDLASLVGEPMESSTACEGETAEPSRWRGVRVGTLLGRARPRADASHALVHSADPDYACGFDLDRLRDALLAVRLDGEPIPTERGGPVRLLVDDADCWERVKWVSRIDVLDEPPGDADTARDVVPADD